MSITSYKIKRVGSVTVVTVVSNLSDPLYYHWYQDGKFIGMTRENKKAFSLAPGVQSRIIVNDTNDPDYDSVGNEPSGYRGRRKVGWCRSISTDVDRYKIEERVDSGDWTAVAYVRHTDRKWYYSWESNFLTDLGAYEWKVTPVDFYGNEGTVISYTSETIVRLPDAPYFTFAYDEDTDKITFEEL